MLPRQEPPQPPPDLVNVLAEDDRIGTGEIDIFKDAEGMAMFAMRKLRFYAVGRNFNHLTRFDIAFISGSDNIKGAGFRGNHPVAVPFAQRQGPKSPRVAGGNNAILTAEHVAISAFEFFNGVTDFTQIGFRFGASNQMEDNLGIGSRLKNGTFGFQILLEVDRIGQVAVVAHRQHLVPVGNYERLDIGNRIGPGG